MSSATHHHHERRRNRQTGTHGIYYIPVDEFVAVFIGEAITGRYLDGHGKARCAE
jgi:hypothetical protein